MNELNVPNHIGLVPDGNRRWATERGKPKVEGHRKGAERLKEFIENCFNLGIPQVTVWVLSTENLKRTKEELDYLFDLIGSEFENVKKRLSEGKNKVSIKFHGDLEKLPESVTKKLRDIEEESSKYNEKRLNIMIAYGGRYEIKEAVKKILNSGQKEITEEKIKENLFVSDDVDLVIRTGAMKRLSGFMPYQTTYSELYFTDTFWPAFDKEELIKAIEWFNTVKRNFGK